MGYVSKLAEYQEHGILSGGNEPVNLSRNNWTYADLEVILYRHIFRIWPKLHNSKIMIKLNL